MKSLLKRLAKRLFRRRPPPVPLRKRFEHFLALCQANDDFLRDLARLNEKSESGERMTMGELVLAADALADHLRRMVTALNRMAQDRYGDLLARLEEIERSIAIEVFKERPIEYGPFVVWPSEAEALRPEVVGGKAAHLASLWREPGLKIPPFFVITTYAFHHFMQASGLRERVDDFIRGFGGEDDTVKEACEGIRAAIMASPLPKDLESEIVSAYRKLAFGKGLLVAVRSSAVVEDSEVSFAGQFETVLGVGEDGLVDAYRRVVASKYRWQALKYARMAGLLDEEVAMPVLVMAMVDPVASGVAYSLDLERPEAVLVTAVPGLASAMVEGKTEPDRFIVSRNEPHEILEVVRGKRSKILRCREGGGVEEVEEETPVDEEIARPVAKVAVICERHFGHPQDIEWALSRNGTLYVVQSRPLFVEAKGDSEEAEDLASFRVLASGGVRACGGVAAGKVVHLFDVEEAQKVEEGSVLVVPTTSPRLAGLVGKAKAILAATGSATGHMATVAREFHVPMLVGILDVFARVPHGALVTVDAWNGRVYEGIATKALEGGRTRSVQAKDPVRKCLEQFLLRASPLTLGDPRSPDFRVSECRSYHDIARFAHQKAMTEMFLIEGLSPRERREARSLDWKIPLEVLVLDLGGGIRPGAGERVTVADITSIPFSAIIEGMTDPRVRWAGPVGFDLKGFMSVVMRSAADDQRYGEPSFALCSKEFVHFSSRLAYHFATVAAMAGPSSDQNYVRFVFHGGAAVAQRREWRAYFLATVLRYHGFQVILEGDRVEAVLGKREVEAVEEALVMLGRLMVSARHLDMMMESKAAAEAYAAAFLSGDYGFESLWRGGGGD